MDPRPAGVAVPDAALALTPDEQIDFDERAAIMEFDGGLTREEAEAAALVIWLAGRKRSQADPIADLFEDSPALARLRSRS